jgi:capping protein beta
MERLISLRPEYGTDLRNAIDVPSKVIVCPNTKQEFLACDYNRIGDAYRSPWSQEFVGLNGEQASETTGLPERLVEMEKLANKAFGTYRQLYYEGGISSAYFWPCDTEKEFAFGAAILLQKCVEQEGDLVGARWDSIHVIEVEQQKGTGEATFCMTSTVLLDLDGDFAGIDDFKLNGSMTRQQETAARIGANDSDFVAAIGRLVEEMEGRMRSGLQEIYFGKTHEIVNELRPAALPEGFLRNQGDFRDEMRMRCGAK